MKVQQNNWIWGIVLIVLGGLFLLESLGYIPNFAPMVWSAVFAVGSLFFFVMYFRNGLSEWGWLFPAMILGGLAIVIALADANVEGTWIGALFMACVSVPFWVGYGVDRQENWWAAIPGWVTAVLTLIILFSNQVAGELIGTLVMWSIALPFFVVYLTNRQHWWALIPGFVLGMVGLVVLLSNQVGGEWIGTLVMFAIALPFFAVYLYSRKQWWALIPAGILATIGLIVPFASQIEPDNTSARLVGVVLFLGMAAPFAFLWWRQKEYLTDWARYPAVGLILFALLTLVFGNQVETMWPVLLIGIGLWLLYNNSYRPKLKP
jgi:hypothetical protein